MFDTSCYLNGKHDHLPLATFPSVWSLVAEAIRDGRIVMPREVYRELTAQDDAVAEWIGAFVANIVEPSEQVQRLAGQFMACNMMGATAQEGVAAFIEKRVPHWAAGGPA